MSAIEYPPELKANEAILSADEKSVAELLLRLGQQALFKNWPAAGTKDAEKKALLEQVAKLDGQYPGGLTQYVENAKKLLEESKNGVNPYDGYVPSVPLGERLEFGTKDFDESEARGLAEAPFMAFVLVAGGLGERLGYNGIKLDLPCEITTETCFLERYAQSILKLQERARQVKGYEKRELPLFIMTSGDTHDKTLELLQANNRFGLSENQLTICKQEKVPALLNNDAHFAVEEDGFTIETKPHGHGDVHMLLHSSGTIAKWHADGFKWALFFQDTNGIVFHALPTAVGVSAKNNFVVNSLTCARRPGEAVGAICQLEHKDGKKLTINVEYNQLDPLLRGTVNSGGDVADASGYSPYPGNLNVLIFKIDVFKKILDETKGAIPEFVNPKYANDAKTVFKKPTRIESMMQDFPKLLGPDDKVGFTQLDRWLAFSPVKNDLESAAAKAKSTGFPESASSGEANIYRFFRQVLGHAGAEVNVDGKMAEFGGVPTQTGARIVIAPSTAFTVSGLRERFPSPAKVKISDKSTLVIKGDVTVHSLDLDGALVIEAAPGAHVVVDGLKVANEGWDFKPIQQTDDVHEKYKIRGYVLEKKAQEVLTFDKAGKHKVPQ